MYARRTNDGAVSTSTTSTVYRSYRRCLMETATKRRLRASFGVSDRVERHVPAPLSFRLRRAQTEAEAVQMVEADAEKWIRQNRSSIDRLPFPLVACVCLRKGVCFARSAFLSTAAPRRGTLPDLEQQPSPQLFQ